MEDVRDIQVVANPSATKTVLVVEDDIELGFVLAQMLKEEITAQVLFATDGFQALKIVHSAMPDLILLDCLLPKVDGLKIVEVLRSSKETEHIPIILMSAHMPKNALEREGLLLLEKPFELDRLIQLVKHHLTTS